MIDQIFLKCNSSVEDWRLSFMKVCRFLIIIFSSATNLIFCDFQINPEKEPLIRQVLEAQDNYCAITINGKEYQGGRIWQERWPIIKSAIKYKDLNILDLGCNIGINPICLKKYTKARSVTGIDKNFLDSAKVLASAFEVDVNFIQADFDDSSIRYEDIIGYDYDLVFCLSVFYWIKDKVRFLNYLSHFNKIIYEGHFASQIEIARFKKLGYKYRMLGTSYSGKYNMTPVGRTIILFYK